MSTLHKQPTPEDLRLLSAYIDGELSSSERAELEARLENDAALRAELASLRQTVELVRTLPRLKAPRNFTLDPAVYQKQAPAKIIQFAAWRLASSVSLAASVILIIVGMLLIGIDDDGTEPAREQPVSERDDTQQSLELTREAVSITADTLTRAPTATATVEIRIESLPQADDYDGFGPGEGFSEGATGLGAGDDNAMGDDFPPAGEVPMMPPGPDNGFGGGDDGAAVPSSEFGPMQDMPSPAPTQASEAVSAEADDLEDAEEDMADMTFAAEDEDEAAEAEEAAEDEDTIADDAIEEEALAEEQMRSANETEMSAAQAEDGESEPAAPMETEEAPIEDEERDEAEDDVDIDADEDDNVVAIALLIAGVLGTVVSGGVLFYTWRRPSANQA